MYPINKLVELVSNFKDPASYIKNKWIKWTVRIVFFVSVILTLYFSTLKSSYNSFTVKTHDPVKNVLLVTNTSPHLPWSLDTVWKVQDYHLLEILTYLCTLAGSVAGTWTYIVKPVIGVCKKAKSTYEHVEYISEQLRPNGGGSAYDSIKRTALAVDSNTESIKKLENRTQKIHELVIVTSEKSHILFDQEPIAMYECSMDGKCIWTNSALQQLFGLTFDETLGDGWLAALHPDDIRETYENWMATVKNWIPYRVRYRIINVKTKEEYTVEATAKIVKCEVGKPLTAIGTITVIK